MAQTDLTGGGLLGAGLAGSASPAILRLDRTRLAFAAATLAAFATAEVVTVFTDPITGIALHGATLLALLAASGLGGRGESVADGPLSRLLYFLALVPLIRIVSLTMPLGRFDQTYWFLAAGLPVFVAGVVVTGTLGIRPKDIGLRLSRRGLHLQLLVAVFGLGLGFSEYHILRPDALIDDLTFRQMIVPALVIMFATGFLEEFIFRGILQRLAEGFFGRSGFLYVSLIFAILHIGYRSATDFMFVFAIALLYGWVVRRTGSIIGVSVSHGITNITLFLLIPFIPALAAQPGWLPLVK
ncbi:MAG TPA: type II CAAX endopeptidase family protein [Dehalococcoidia bacterium]|nr:type II CAAX endopeptidase family protein [Dehalococcoidia bacterium]